MDKDFELARTASDNFSKMMQQAASGAQVGDFLPDYLAHRISAKPELLARLVPGNHVDDIAAIDAILDSCIRPNSLERRRDILTIAYAFVCDPANAPHVCGAGYAGNAASALDMLSVDEAVCLTSRIEHLRATIEIHMHVGLPIFDEDEGADDAAPLLADKPNEPMTGH